MEKVYIVYYDNGMTYEDHDVSVNKIFRHKEDATAYAEKRNQDMQVFTPSISKEDYEKTPDEYNARYSYEDFCEMERDDWMSRYPHSNYYVSIEEVF